MSEGPPDVGDGPSHPHGRAILVIVLVTLLIVVLAAVSTFA
jgi:hypothetical protein